MSERASERASEAEREESEAKRSEAKRSEAKKERKRANHWIDRNSNV